MREINGLWSLTIVMVLAVYMCEGFHLQGMPGVRQAVCRRAPPCCPGHVCRPYQRFDASRPVAACAQGLHAQPLYAPGSRAQRRFCGSSSADRFGQRRISLRGGRQGFSGRRQRFPGQQIGGGQPWGLGDQQQIRTDRTRFDPFRPNPQFGSQRNPSRFPISGPGLGRQVRGSQLNTLAPVPQEQRPFVQGQLQFPQGRTGFSQGRTGFSQGRTGFTQARGGFSRAPSTFSQGRTSFSQGLSSFPQGRASFTQGQAAFSQGQPSLSRGAPSFSQDPSFIQQQSIGSGQGFVDGQDFLSQFSEVTQGSSLSTGGQPFTDPSLGFSGLLPLDGAPQPMLVEEPSVTVSRVPGSTRDRSSSSVSDQSLTLTDMTSILAALDSNSQPKIVEQQVMPVSQAQATISESGASVPQDLFDSGASFTQLTPDVLTNTDSTNVVTPAEYTHVFSPIESVSALTPVQSSKIATPIEAANVPTSVESVQQATFIPEELAPYAIAPETPLGTPIAGETPMIELTAVELAQLTADGTVQQIPAGSTDLMSDVPTLLTDTGPNVQTSPIADLPLGLTTNAQSTFTSDVPTSLVSESTLRLSPDMPIHSVSTGSVQQTSDTWSQQRVDVTQPQRMSGGMLLKQQSVVSNSNSNSNNNIL